MTPEKRKQSSGPGRSPAFKVVFGVVLIVALAGLAKIFIWPGAKGKAPVGDSYQPASSPGSRYHYYKWSGDQGGSGKAEQTTGQTPGVRSGMPRVSSPNFRTSQQMNPKEDPEGFIRQTFEERPWLWEKASPEDKEKIFEGYRQKMLEMMEMNKENSSGTGRGMGKKIHELRWAGREKKGGRHARHQQLNPAGENGVNPGAEGAQAPPPGTGGGNWKGKGGNPGNNNGGGQGSGGY